MAVSRRLAAATGRSLGGDPGSDLRRRLGEAAEVVRTGRLGRRLRAGRAVAGGTSRGFALVVARLLSDGVAAGTIRCAYAIPSRPYFFAGLGMLAVSLGRVLHGQRERIGARRRLERGGLFRPGPRLAGTGGSDQLGQSGSRTISAPDRAAEIIRGASCQDSIADCAVPTSRRLYAGGLPWASRRSTAGVKPAALRATPLKRRTDPAANDPKNQIAQTSRLASGRPGTYHGGNTRNPLVELWRGSDHDASTNSSGPVAHGIVCAGSVARAHFLFIRIGAAGRGGADRGGLFQREGRRGRSAVYRQSGRRDAHAAVGARKVSAACRCGRGPIGCGRLCRRAGR